MIVRPAAGADADEFAQIHAEAFETPWSAEDLRRFIENGFDFALAAESAGALAGFILCRVMAGEAEILTLAVRPAHRRRGVALALVKEALRLAAATADAAFLEVAADDPGAAALYEKAGFSAVGRRLGYYARRAGSAADAIVMRRPLNS